MAAAAKSLGLAVNALIGLGLLAGLTYFDPFGGGSRFAALAFVGYVVGFVLPDALKEFVSPRLFAALFLAAAAGMTGVGLYVLYRVTMLGSQAAALAVPGLCAAVLFSGACGVHFFVTLRQGGKTPPLRTHRFGVLKEAAMLACGLALVAAGLLIALDSPAAATNAALLGWACAAFFGAGVPLGLVRLRRALRAEGAAGLVRSRP